MATARIALLEARRSLDLAGEQPATERGVGNESNAELARGPQRLLGLGAVEQRILALHRRDRMSLVRAADGLGLGFAESQGADFALLRQFCHRADRLLDRHLRI